VRQRLTRCDGAMVLGTAAAAALQLCDALHPCAFDQAFRLKCARDSWKHQVMQASLRCGLALCARGGVRVREGV
jgi:hypothetical protein